MIAKLKRLYEYLKNIGFFDFPTPYEFFTFYFPLIIIFTFVVCYLKSL